MRVHLSFMPSRGKWSILRWAAALGGILLNGTCLAALPSLPAWVVETDTSFSVRGDWDGNGLDDVALVEKTTGLVRFGYQTAPQRFTWSEPESSGVENVTSCGMGTFFDGTRRSILLTAPEANRVQMLRMASPASPPDILPIFATGVGPFAVIPLPAHTDGRQDLLVSTIWNGTPPYRLETLANLTNSFASQTSTNFNTPLHQPNLVRLRSEGPLHVAYVSETEAPLTLRIAQADTRLTQAASVPSLPAGVRYLYGHFDGSGFAHLLFHVPGQALLSTIQATNSDGKFALGSPGTFQMPRTISQVHAVPGTNDTRLLVLFAPPDEHRAAIYTFNGRSAPVLVQEFQAPPHQSFDGAISFPGGNVLLTSGQPGSPSTQYQLQQRTGATYSLLDSGSLPAVENRAPGANLLFFSADPFYARNVPVVSAQRRGDWTSQLRFTNSPASASFKSERRGDERTGLHQPSQTSLPFVPHGAKAALPNQLSDSMSLFSFAPAIGDMTDDVTISPAPGEYSESVAVTLSPSQIDTTIYYRTVASDLWRPFSTPLLLSRNTQLEYFPQRSGGKRGIIEHASYTFSKSPADLDSDADGVPDFVETARGMDPMESGWDADGDGASDLSELLHGTDPTNASFKPGSRADVQASYDLLVTPRPYDWTRFTNSFAMAGSEVRVFDFEGGLLGRAALARPNTNSLASSAILTNISYSHDQRLIALATEPHFAARIGLGSLGFSRELLGIHSTESTTPAEIAYSDQGRSLAVEAAAWVNALRSTPAYKTRALESTELSIETTLAALLLERKAGLLLADRGAVAQPRISLFSFRPDDQGRTPVTFGMLNSLEVQTNSLQSTAPAYRLMDVLLSIQSRLSGTNSQALRTAAQFIYAASAQSNQTASVPIPSPIQALRMLIEDQRLPAPYTQNAVVPVLLAQWAINDVSNLLQQVPSRPVRQMVLRVANEGSVCTTLISLENKPVNLVDAFGQPSRLSELFPLLPGSLVSVRGYADVRASCPGETLELIDATLQALPADLDSDRDGNSLPDPWEQFFLGNNGSDANADADGDLFSNLQEYLEGTSPVDALSKPNGNPTDLGRPEIQIQRFADGRLRLSWSWPAEYASRVRFSLRTSENLQSGYTEVPVSPVQIAPDKYEVWLNPTNPRQAFYQVYYQVIQ